MQNNFQTAEMDAALERLNGAKQVQERDPFIGEGDHMLMLVNLEPFKHKQHGASVRASFEVLASPCHPVGSRVTKLWFLTKPSKFETQTNDSDRFTDFVVRMLGAQPGTNVAQQIRSLIRDRVGDQLMRGMIIGARGSNTSKNPTKPWVEVYWTSQPQTPDQIKARRTPIDARIASAPPAQEQAPQQYAPQTQYAAQPPQQAQYAPQFVQQPQAMPQQYVPQFAPQMPPQMPAQQFAPNNPANYAQQFAPSAQPQFAPSAQPQFAPQIQPLAQQSTTWPPQANAPAQQGPGLLAQVPGAGNWPQGGNGGSF